MLKSVVFFTYKSSLLQLFFGKNLLSRKEYAKFMATLNNMNVCFVTNRNWVFSYHILIDLDSSLHAYNASIGWN